VKLNKRSKLIALFSILILCANNPVGAAANDYTKCPDTWSLTTTDDSVLQRELAEAKVRLGGNLAVSIVSREIEDSGSWKVFATEKYSSGEANWLKLLELPMRTNLKIEVKGCPTALKIYSPMSIGNLTLIKSSYSTLYEDVLKALPQSSVPADFSNRLKSYNFKQLEDSINLLKQTVQSNISDLKSGANNTVRGSYKFNDGAKVRQSVLLTMNPVGDAVISNPLVGSVELLPERLSCVVLGANIISPQVAGPFKWITPNKTCNYQLVAYLPTINTMFQIDSITIQTATTEINCIKGKLVKKVAGINPKCPAGYKKK
jgi:hypothetical protein